MRQALAILVTLLLPMVAQAQDTSPYPVTEDNVTGTLDLGYRWVSDTGGDRNTYRSLVNLNEGFRVLGLDFYVRDPDRKLFDKLTFFANNWGDPYNTARVDAERTGTYRFTVDYRNIAYFNFLPSFANPGIAAGSLVNQRSFDIKRRLWNSELELLPGKRVVPYVAVSRDSGWGSGITPFVENGNEYPVGNELRDETNNYRGGVRLELRRWHVTLEQGGSAFKDDQRVSTNDLNFGNRTTPLLGQTLALEDLNQAYGIRGRSIYSKGLLTAAPAKWIDLYGQFLFSRPRSEVNYSEDGRGLFWLGATRFFNGLGGLTTGEAKQPHTSGSFSAELRPHRRLRIVESIMTDRLHNASSALLVERAFFASGNTEVTEIFAADRLVMNYNRQQVDVFFDITSKVTIRGGHRYEWGDSSVRAATLNPSGIPESGELKRHVGLFGLNLRPTRRLRVNADYEGASSDSSYFRTSLHDYHQFRARGQYQLTPDIDLGLRFRLLDNENPTQGIDYDLRSYSASASVRWRPGGGRYLSLFGNYTRSSIRSDILFLRPPFFSPAGSFYRDRAHAVRAILDVNLPSSHPVVVPKLSVGGSLYLSSGSRPADYYQPTARFLLPIHKHVSCYAEWRWYGYSQTFYLFEGFRTHHLAAGLRLSM